MSVCVICSEEYYRQSETDPAEPCACGEMADGTPWLWDRWRGVYNRLRYRFAAFCIRRANAILMAGYQPKGPR